MNEQDKPEKSEIINNPANLNANANANAGEHKKHDNPKGDFLLRIISVLAAILIWFWVVGFETQITTKKFTSIPVYVENLDEDYTVFNSEIDNIDVILEGKSSDLNRIKASDIYAYVDLNNVSQAVKKSFVIEIKEMDSVHVVDQSQSMTQTIYIDQYISAGKTIPVKDNIIQKFIESDVEIGELILSPDEVVVYGPKSILDNLSYAQVDISLGTNPLNRPVKVTEKFRLMTENGKEISDDDKQYITTKDITVINVEVPVTMTKEVPLVLNYKYGYYNDKNTKITVIPNKIKIVGSPDDIKNISSINLKEVIDEKKYENDTTVTSSVVLPDGIESLDGETAQIEIKFVDPETKIIDISTRKNVNFNVAAPKNSEYHIKEERIQIKILGPSENVKNINSSKISVAVDLSSYEKGAHSDVPVDISIISDDAVFCVGEYKINVEIY